VSGVLWEAHGRSHHIEDRPRACGSTRGTTRVVCARCNSRTRCVVFYQEQSLTLSLSLSKRDCCWVSPAAAVSPVKRATLAVEEGTQERRATRRTLRCGLLCTLAVGTHRRSLCQRARAPHAYFASPQGRVVLYPSGGCKTRHDPRLRTAAPAGSSSWVYSITGAYHHRRTPCICVLVCEGPTALRNCVAPRVV
jgi:hypothetical protein